MAAKKTRREMLYRLEALVDELDGLVFTLKYYEERLIDTGGDTREAVKRGGIRPTSKRVQKVQNKSNEIWRALESYRNRVMKERP